jgi:hypothetical protein
MERVRKVGFMRNWTSEEDGQLLEMLRLDFNPAVIAKALDRSEGDIRARRSLLKTLRDCDSGWTAARDARRAPARA